MLISYLPYTCRKKLKPHNLQKPYYKILTVKECKSHNDMV